MRVYNKAPLKYQDQVELLKQRGLKVFDEKRAVEYLKRISYYRLSAFFLPYQQKKDQFNEGISFDQVLDTYKFDRELRLLVFDAIERVEVAIRTQIVYCLALKYNDAHWQDKKSVFKPPFQINKRTIDAYGEIQQIIDNAKNTKHPEVFIKHYMREYQQPANPPSWMCLELLTIGELSRLYKGLASNTDKQMIASFFGLHHTVFTSWLHTLTYVRNICAHHARLWNRTFAIKPDVLKKPQRPWVDKAFENNQRTFYFICVLKYLLNAANPGNHLKEKLIRLFQKFESVPVRFMGIPTNTAGEMLDWVSQPLWEN